MIKNLPFNFKKACVYYSQVKRKKDFVIYSLRYSEKGSIVGFDVVRIRKYAPFRDLAESCNTVPEKIETIECFPSSEKYGSTAWSFNSLENAESKFHKLTGKK